MKRKTAWLALAIVVAVPVGIAAWLFRDDYVPGVGVIESARAYEYQSKRKAFETKHMIVWFDYSVAGQQYKSRKFYCQSLLRSFTQQVPAEDAPNAEGVAATLKPGSRVAIWISASDPERACLSRDGTLRVRFIGEEQK